MIKSAFEKSGDQINRLIVHGSIFRASDENLITEWMIDSEPSGDAFSILKGELNELSAGIRAFRITESVLIH